MTTAVAILNIALILILIAAAGIGLWRMITTRRFPLAVCLFLILPAGLLLMLHSSSFEEGSVSWVLGLLLGMLAYILLLLYTIQQEKRTAAQEELLETKHRIELEKSHYEAVLHRRGELEKLRRDFNEKLETVAGLIRSEEDAQARRSISGLAAEISRTEEKRYCKIPVINAVLTQKEAECGEAGIVLEVDLNLPDELAAEPMHLCSIFSNILDNAIAACRNIECGDKPVIRLASMEAGDYLMIKAVNPSNKPKHKAVPGHGYGLRILSELAKQYGGEFQGSYRDGMYTAVISLLVMGQGD